MKKSIISLLVSCFVIAIVQWSCLNDAERGNPLDPKSDNFINTGTISGQITTMALPFTALPDVEVRLEPGILMTKTDSEGKFQFEDVDATNYAITATKNGYATVVDSINVTRGKNAFITLHLDGLPIFSSISLFTCHILRWFPQNDLYLLEIETIVEDPDGANDISFVEVTIPSLMFTDTLNITQTIGTYRKRIPSFDLPLSKFHDILGRQVFIKARDRADFEIISQPKFLFRIIDQIPESVSPKGLQILNVSKPTLIWKHVELPFNFTYRIELVSFVDEILEKTIWTENISQNDTTITVPDSLAVGSYYWTVSVVDDFGNYGRNKEASFQIKQR